MTEPWQWILLAVLIGAPVGFFIGYELGGIPPRPILIQLQLIPPPVAH